MEVVKNPEEWIICSYCNSSDVDLDNFKDFDLRTIVDCNQCEASGFFDIW